MKDLQAESRFYVSRPFPDLQDAAIRFNRTDLQEGSRFDPSEHLSDSDTLFLADIEYDSIPSDFRNPPPERIEFTYPCRKDVRESFSHHGRRHRR